MSSSNVRVVFNLGMRLTNFTSQTEKDVRASRPHPVMKPIISTPLPNPSLQVTADHTLKQVEAPVYEPGIGEVLLHVKTTGVCG